MITLICGLPRAGKTTYSRRYEGACKVFHVDECGCRLRMMLSNYIGTHPDEDVVVEGVFRSPERRMSVIRPYKNDKKVCIWLNTPKEIRATREGYREKQCEYPFEPPTYDEGWDEIIVLGEDNGIY